MTEVQQAALAPAVLEVNEKQWWASQTIWGGVSVIGSSLAGAWIAYKSGNLEAMGAALMAAFGGIQAIIGRVRADAAIRK